MEENKNQIQIPIRLDCETIDFYLYDLPEENNTEDELKHKNLKYITSLTINNTSNNDILLRIRTNKKELYSVNPIYGLIEKEGNLEVKINYHLLSLKEDFSKHKLRFEVMEIENLKEIIERNVIPAGNPSQNHSQSPSRKVKGITKTFLKKNTFLPGVSIETLNLIIKRLFDRNDKTKEFPLYFLLKHVQIYYKKTRYQAVKLRIASRNESNSKVKPVLTINKQSVSTRQINFSPSQSQINQFESPSKLQCQNHMRTGLKNKKSLNFLRKVNEKVNENRISMVDIDDGSLLSDVKFECYLKETLLMEEEERLSKINKKVDDLEESINSIKSLIERESLGKGKNESMCIRLVWVDVEYDKGVVIFSFILGCVLSLCFI